MKWQRSARELRAVRALTRLKQIGPLLAVAGVSFWLACIWKDHQLAAQTAHVQKMAEEVERQKQEIRGVYQHEHDNWQRVYTAWLAQHPQYQQESLHK